MTTERSLRVYLAFASILAGVFALPAQAQDKGSDKDKACLECHAALTRKTVVHAPMHSGCETCHVGLDGSVRPHKPKAGSASAAVVPCVKCHEKKLFEGKVVHGPVASGTCILCHDPHASDHLGLLRKSPAASCLDCHAEVAKTPHVVAGFSRAGHPLGEETPGKAPKEDPLRPGRPFYCVSCHEPHRSELPSLMRPPTGMASCQSCHKM